LRIIYADSDQHTALLICLVITSAFSLDLSNLDATPRIAPVNPPVTSPYATDIVRKSGFNSTEPGSKPGKESFPLPTKKPRKPPMAPIISAPKKAFFAIS